VSAGQEAGRVDDSPLVSAVADLLAGVEGLDVEHQATAVDLEKLSVGADLDAGWSRCQMADVDAHTNGDLTIGEEGFDGRAGGVFHERDQGWGGKHVEAAGADGAGQERVIDDAAGFAAEASAKRHVGVI
jgi:hypothetical protein